MIEETPLFVTHTNQFIEKTGSFLAWHKKDAMRGLERIRTEALS